MLLQKFVHSIKCIFDLKNPPVIAHIKNTDLKENPKENRPDCSGTIERDILEMEDIHANI